MLCEAGELLYKSSKIDNALVLSLFFRQRILKNLRTFVRIGGLGPSLAFQDLAEYFKLDIVASGDS